MRLDIYKTLAHKGETEKYQVTPEIAEVSHTGATYTICDRQPFELSVSNEGGTNLYIEGEATVSVMIPCDRCLSDVSVEFPITISESFEIKDEMIVTDPEENSDLAEGKEIDVDRILLNEIQLHWPDKVLCSENCKGLCPVCGKNRNITECDCDRTVLDPRMAKFLDVFDQFKEV